MTKEVVHKKIIESSQLISKVAEQESENIVKVADVIIEAYKKGNKLLIAGNGGSAADAQHISAELVNTYYKNRKALPAIALTTDTSIITAWSNDKHYDYIFERQIEAHGKPGDIFLAITTSGNSTNLIHAVKKAKELGLTTIGLLGKSGGKLKGECDHEIIIPHHDTARIQEAHHVVYHIICDLIESKLFSD